MICSLFSISFYGRRLGLVEWTAWFILANRCFCLRKRMGIGLQVARHWHFGNPKISTLRELYSDPLSSWMGCDRGDNFPFGFEQNGISSGWKSKGNVSLLSNFIQFEMKINYPKCKKKRRCFNWKSQNFPRIFFCLIH